VATSRRSTWRSFAVGVAAVLGIFSTFISSADGRLNKGAPTVMSSPDGVQVQVSEGPAQVGENNHQTNIMVYNHRSPGGPPVSRRRWPYGLRATVVWVAVAMAVGGLAWAGSTVGVPPFGARPSTTPTVSVGPTRSADPSSSTSTPATPTESTPPSPSRGGRKPDTATTAPQDPGMHNAGPLGMQVDSMADLDKGPPGNDTYDLRLDSTGQVLSPLNNTAIALVSGGHRDMLNGACTGVPLQYGSINLTDLPIGRQVCFRTSANRPGMFEVIPPDPEYSEVLRYSFVVWNT